MEKQIKKAIESAEQEIQEREIANLKKIIKDLLEKKKSKEDDKREIEKEISVIKQTIEDFKSGRLDKIKELQEKDETAKEILPFKVIIVNQPVITQPWYWTYRVEPTYPVYPTITCGGNNITSYAGSSVLCNNVTNTCSAGLTGNTFATFTAGSYQAGNGIINL